MHAFQFARFARFAATRSAAERRWRAALDGLLPPACALCTAPGAPLCGACAAAAASGLDTACASCAMPLPREASSLRCGRCLRRQPAYDATWVATLYDPPFDQLVRGLKYGAMLAYAPLFARLLAARPSAAEIATIDLVVPVPLSRARMADRGFNQALEIARPLARALAKPVDHDVLLRVVDTVAQASLPFDDRRRNIRGAFAIGDARRAGIVGRRIALVDDVMTTGATLDECARTLKRAGAVRVVNLVVARTP